MKANDKTMPVMTSLASDRGQLLPPSDKSDPEGPTLRVHSAVDDVHASLCSPSRRTSRGPTAGRRGVLRTRNNASAGEGRRRRWPQRARHRATDGPVVREGVVYLPRAIRRKSHCASCHALAPGPEERNSTPGDFSGCFSLRVWGT